MLLQVFNSVSRKFSICWYQLPQWCFSTSKAKTQHNKIKGIMASLFIYFLKRNKMMKPFSIVYCQVIRLYVFLMAVMIWTDISCQILWLWNQKSNLSLILQFPCLIAGNITQNNETYVDPKNIFMFTYYSWLPPLSPLIILMVVRVNLFLT